MSVRMEQLGSHWTDFHDILYLIIFRKSVKNVQGSLKSDKNSVRVLYVKTDIQFWSYPAQIFLEWKIFQTKVVYELETHVLCSAWENEFHTRTNQQAKL